MGDLTETDIENLFNDHCTDGVVTRDAFKTVLQRLKNNPTEEEIADVFSNFDTDEQEGLSLDEFKNYIEKCYIPEGEARQALVDALKTLFENDITIDELVEKLQNNGQEKLSDEDAENLRQELIANDKDGNGIIDPEEFAEFLNDQKRSFNSEEVTEEQTEDQTEDTVEETQETTEETQETTEETQETTEQEEKQEEEQENTEQDETQEGEQTETQEGEQTETQDGEQTETQEGEQTETQEGEQTETQEGEQTETQEGEQTENQEGGEQTENPENQDGEQTENKEES